MKKSSLGNSFLLFLTACIWGMAFVSQSKGMEYMHPFTFNGVRSLIGAFALLIYLLATGQLSGKKKDADESVAEGKDSVSSRAEGTARWKKNLEAGIWCGLALTVASTLQQFGIKYTTIGKAGFITTLYIIFVPLAGIFLRKKVAKMVWAAAVMAAVGMYLLCMTESLTLSGGDAMVFLCAIAFAIHILIIDYYAPYTDGAIVSCIQFFVCGVVCIVGAFIWGSPALGQLTSGLGALLYAGVLSCGVAYTLQIVGQKGVDPTVAALILSLESVVAAVSGWIAFRVGFLTDDQTLTPRQITGCVIVFAAVILVQLPKGCFRRKEKV